jgi:zinc-ribbon domain
MSSDQSKIALAGKGAIAEKIVSLPPTSEPRSIPQIEKMRLCTSCNKAIGDSERFCSYCGSKQVILHAEPQTSLDPYTMKTAVAMLAKITEAKDHSEYSTIDQLTTMIGEVALGKEKPHDANELIFSDQLRLLTLVFEYTRDKVGYKGEAFGEYIRWPWETIKTGGDCDCKVVLLATMLASLAFRRMHILVLPPGTYLDTKENRGRKMQGHVMLEVELSEKNRTIRVMLDPSCQDCDVDEIPESVKPFLQNLYRIPIIP